jgi:hypothetical protein
MAFRITRLIFALGIGHVFRFSLDLRTGRAGAFAVRINVSDMHDETGTGHVCCAWRINAVRGRDAV